MMANAVISAEAQVIRLFIEKQNRSRLHPFDITPIRNQIEVQLQNLRLAVMPF